MKKKARSLQGEWDEDNRRKGDKNEYEQQQQQTVTHTHTHNHAFSLTYIYMCVHNTFRMVYICQYVNAYTRCYMLFVCSRERA